MNLLLIGNEFQEYGYLDQKSMASEDESVEFIQTIVDLSISMQAINKNGHRQYLSYADKLMQYVCNN